MIKHLIMCHNFFMTESPKYTGPLCLKDKFRFPIVYLRFMKYSIIDYIRLV